MLRLTPMTHNPQQAILKLEGWVVNEDVAVLAAEGRHWLASARLLVLDLADVKAIDDAGLALLAEWAGPRLELRNASAYMRTVLTVAGLQPA